MSVKIADIIKRVQEKEAAPAWVKLLQKGLLSDDALKKVLSYLPDQEAERYVKHLGSGGFQTADLMASPRFLNSKMAPGLGARKVGLPEGFNPWPFIGSQRTPMTDAISMPKLIEMMKSDPKFARRLMKNIDGGGGTPEEFISKLEKKVNDPTATYDFGANPQYPLERLINSSVGGNRKARRLVNRIRRDAGVSDDFSNMKNVEKSITSSRYQNADLDEISTILNRRSAASGRTGDLPEMLDRQGTRSYWEYAKGDTLYDQQTKQLKAMRKAMVDPSLPADAREAAKRSAEGLESGIKSMMHQRSDPAKKIRSGQSVIGDTDPRFKQELKFLNKLSPGFNDARAQNIVVHTDPTTGKEVKKLIDFMPGDTPLARGDGGSFDKRKADALTTDLGIKDSLKNPENLLLDRYSMGGMFSRKHDVPGMYGEAIGATYKNPLLPELHYANKIQDPQLREQAIQQVYRSSQPEGRVFNLPAEISGSKKAPGAFQQLAAKVLEDLKGRAGRAQAGFNENVKPGVADWFQKGRERLMGPKADRMRIPHNSRPPSSSIGFDAWSRNK